MADLSPTLSDVRQVSAENLQRVQFGEAASPGEAVYLKVSDSKYWLANCGDSAKSVVAGVVIIGNEADGWGYIANEDGGEVDMGTTVVVGTEYVVSDTDGAIMPSTDLTTGQYYSLVGIGSTSTNIRLSLDPTGIQHP